MGTDEQAIRNLVEQWQRATADGDVDSVLRSGSVLSIFRKQTNGSWMLVRDANLLPQAA